MKKYLEIGRINNTHGIKGEVKMQLWCDSIDYLKQFDTLYLDSKGEKPVGIKSIKPQKDIAIIKFDGIDSVEQAQELKGHILFCNRDDAEIEDDANYIADLIGCEIIDSDTNKNYGKVADVLNYGSCDIYEIRSNGKQLLIPAIPDVVNEINVGQGYIKINRIKGLFDEN